MFEKMMCCEEAEGPSVVQSIENRFTAVENIMPDGQSS
jgi:hypothetical protein